MAGAVAEEERSSPSFGGGQQRFDLLEMDPSSCVRKSGLYQRVLQFWESASKDLGLRGSQFKRNAVPRNS